MKQVVLIHGEIHVMDVPAPVVGRRDVLVAVHNSWISSGTERSAIQASDLSLLERARKQPENVKKAIDLLKKEGIKALVGKVKTGLEKMHALGYSCSGTVMAVGEEVSHVRVGDLVACAGAGQANHAEIVQIPRNLVVKVPEGCSALAAGSVALGSIAMQGIRRAEVQLGERIAVVGLGLLGQLTVPMLRAAGCKVFGVDINPDRIEMARKRGANVVINAREDNPVEAILQLTESVGADATIITASSADNQLIQQASEMTRKKGRIIVVGAVGLGLSRSPFYEKEQDVRISCSYGPGRYDDQYEGKGIDYPRAYVPWTEQRNMQSYLELIAGGTICPEDLLGAEISVDDAPKAYSLLENPNPPFAVALSYPEAQNYKPEQLVRKLGTPTPKPADTTGIALVGAGGFSMAMHVPNIKKMGNIASFRAVVSRPGLAAQDAAKVCGAPVATTEIEEILDQPDIDMIMVTTRHNLHAPLAIQAIKAGKAVFVEKPAVLTYEELDQLTDALEENPVPYLVGFNRRFSPHIRAIDKVTSQRRGPCVITYEVNAGFVPPDSWVFGPEGGGRIRGEGCHLFDVFQFLIKQEVESMEVLAAKNGTDPSNNAAVIIRYKDGSLATLNYTALGGSKYPKERMRVFVDGKTFDMDNYEKTVVWEGSSPRTLVEKSDKGHFDEMRDFILHVQGKGPAPMSREDWQAVSRLTLDVHTELVS